MRKFNNSFCLYLNCNQENFVIFVAEKEKYTDFYSFNYYFKFKLF